MKRLICLVICFVITLLPCFTAAADSSLTVVLTNKGEKLYSDTYSSIISRIKLNGYAATSVKGNYEGMYIRDAGAQALALTSNGNFTDAQKILNYVYEYHALNKAPYLYTRVGEITSEYTENNFTDEITTGEAFENYSQTEHAKIVAELGKDVFFACGFTATSETIKSLKIFLTGSYNSMSVSVAQMSEDGKNFEVRRSITDHEPFEGNDWKYFEFDREYILEIGLTYYLIFNADVPEDKKLSIMGTTDTAENFYYNAELYGTEWQSTTDSPAIITYSNGFTSDAYTTQILDFSHHIGFGSTVVQEIPSNNEQICEVILNLEKNSSEVKAPLKVSLYADKERTKLIDETLVDASRIPSYAKYIVIPFDYIHSEVPEYYYLCLSSDSDTYNSYYWYGTTSLPGYQSVAYYNNITTEMVGEFSYFTAIMKMSELSTGNAAQSDTAFIFLHSFARWYLKNTNKQAKDAFANKVWNSFSSYAKYFLSSNYYSSELNLIYNPQLRHAKSTYSCYDLSTNVFASQAFYELSQVAEAIGKTSDAENFKKYSELISKGVNENLTTEYNGNKIYAEYRAKYSETPIIAGFSYINLAPAAANWYAVDNQILKNTYDAYLNKATMLIGEYLVTDAEYNISKNTSSNTVMGQNIAWELLAALRFGNSSRAKQLLGFLDQYTEDVYPERWSSSGTAFDPGNQGQGSWIIYALVSMFPDLSKNPITFESQNGIGVDISGGQGTQTITVEETWPLSKIIILGVMIFALILIVASIVLWIISRKTGMKAYARAVAAKRHRDRITNESFDVLDDSSSQMPEIDGFRIKDDIDLD